MDRTLPLLAVLGLSSDDYLAFLHRGYNSVRFEHRDGRFVASTDDPTVAAEAQAVVDIDVAQCELAAGRQDHIGPVRST